jgi:hypothetical protein
MTRKRKVKKDDGLMENDGSSRSNFLLTLDSSKEKRADCPVRLFFRKGDCSRRRMRKCDEIHMAGYSVQRVLPPLLTTAVEKPTSSRQLAEYPTCVLNTHSPEGNAVGRRDRATAPVHNTYEVGSCHITNCSPVELDLVEQNLSMTETRMPVPKACHHKLPTLAPQP